MRLFTPATKVTIININACFTVVKQSLPFVFLGKALQMNYSVQD